MLKKKVGVFLEQEKPAHIILNDNSWLNGYVTKVYDDYFNFLDRKKGEVPIFFVDVAKFEFFKGDLSSLKRPEVGK